MRERTTEQISQFYCFVSRIRGIDGRVHVMVQYSARDILLVHLVVVYLWLLTNFVAVTLHFLVGIWYMVPHGIITTTDLIGHTIAS